jgi:hypothetical protein
MIHHHKFVCVENIIGVWLNLHCMKADVLRCPAGRVALFQVDQPDSAVSRSTGVPAIPGPLDLESALVVCFPTPVDDQGELLLTDL